MSTAGWLRLLRQVLTGVDNETYDIARVLGFCGVVVYLGLGVANWRQFQPQDFGIGFGAAIGGMGAAIGMKAKAEPRKEG